MRTRVVLATVGLLLPVAAYGRAGGGSHYSAPSHSSYSAPSHSSYSAPSHSSYSAPSRPSYSPPSHSSYSPPPSPIYIPSGPTYGHVPTPYSPGSSHGGLICLLVLLVIVIVVVVVAIPSVTSQTRTQAAIEEATGPRGRDLQTILDEIRAQDPAFEPVAFLQKVRATFSTVQESWFIRRLDSARAFMSDGVLRRFMTQQRLMQVEGVRNAVADMKILDARILDVAVTPFFHVLDVATAAAARPLAGPWALHDAQARAKAKGRPAERFTEVWTFARRPGAVTKAGFSLAEGKCPNCGAPFPGGPTAQCEFCQAIVNSGHHDWVLCEITQAEEHRLARPVSDYAEMLAKDAEFNPYAVEDRASLVFWKLCAARAASDIAGLAAVGAPQYRAEAGQKIEQTQQRGQRLSYHEAAVGAVELIHLGLGVSDEGGESVDQAHVRVNWSANQAVVGINERGKPAAVTSSRATVLTLSRPAEAQTPPGRGLATARCGNCGAAPTHDDADRCESCGVDLGAGRSDWVLTAETPFEAWQASAFASAPAGGHVDAPSFAYPSERRRLLHTMAAMAMADGQVSGKERNLLLACADRWHLPRREVESMLDRTAEVDLDLPARGSPASEAFLEGLVAMAMADGRIDRSEDRMLRTVAGHLAVPAARLQGMINEARSIPL